MTDHQNSSAATEHVLSPQAAWDELVHKDDRTSPEEYPDHCLIDFNELQDFMIRGYREMPQSPVPAQSVGMRAALERAQKIIERDYPNGQLAFDIRAVLAAQPPADRYDEAMAALDACIGPARPSSSAGNASVREALELAEDMLSRAPFSTRIWPNGMHPQTGINKIRDAISALNEPQAVPVTDERIEIACEAYADATNYYVKFHRGLSSPSADHMRKGMRAALSSLTRPQLGSGE